MTLVSTNLRRRHRTQASAWQLFGMLLLLSVAPACRVGETRPPQLLDGAVHDVSLPASAEEFQAEGPETVRVRFLVNEQGVVEAAKVRPSKNPLFEKAALELVRSWRFEPGLVDGKPVSTPMEVPIRFGVEKETDREKSNSDSPAPESVNDESAD